MRTCSARDLTSIQFPFRHQMDKTGMLHGYATWFEGHFRGSEQYYMLSTGPAQPCTHWYQMRLLLQEPLGVNKGQEVRGKLTMKANDEQSYDIVLSASIPVLNVHSTNKLDLKDPEYRTAYQNWNQDQTQNLNYY